MARRVSIESDLTLDGKSSPKRRRASKQDISVEQIEIFFATLGETCNVVRSARAAGFSKCWAYRKRKTDAAFRNGWATAVREGYAKLELVLLERAIKGTPKPVFRRDGSERIVREYSNSLAIALLKRHAETADSAAYEPGQEELDEIRERILTRLEKLRARAEANRPPDGSTRALNGGEPPIETKSASGRGRTVELIGWGGMGE